MDNVKKMIDLFWKEEEGLGTLEILLIVAVLVAIAFMFRTKIMGWVTTIFGKTQSEIDKF
jgi:Flp pilus assembly pilin Flp